MAKTIQLTSAQAAKVFGVSSMTLWNWRQGTRSMAPLPTIKSKKATAKPAVFFGVASLKSWAKKHGVVIAQAPEDVLASAPEASISSRPGPKPRQAT